MDIISKKIQPSFKGLTVETRDDGTKHHTFYTPTSIKYDPQKENIQLQVVQLHRKENGDYEPVKGKSAVKLNPADGRDFFKIWTPQSDENSILNIKNSEIKLGYRFLLNGKPLLDEVRREIINGEEYNLAWAPERPDLKKPRSIYHLMPDMILPGDENSIDRRNHCNNFGGKITDIIDRLDYIKDMGFTRILSTPVFNNGPKNSNGYWTKNAYQVDPIRGNLNDFKTLQKELYKRGMGFIADGAFVNESWEGIHIKDIMEHGKKSPFLNWFFVYDPNKPLNAPLLPDKLKPEACKNVGIKIINGPYRLRYTEGKSNPEVMPVKNYDKGLPTKIQIFDRRFASEKQQNNYKELIETYDIKELEDPNEVKSFDETVQPASFSVEPSALEGALKGKDTINPLEFAEKTDWGKNFTIGQVRGATANIDPWDGQNDILKLRFFVKETEEDTLEEDELVELRKASAQVQDNIVQIGEHWTAETEKNLSEYTAKLLSEKLEGKPRTAEEFKKAIDELATADKSFIPPESKDLINVKQIQNLLDGNYELNTAPLPQNITEGIMSYPLEAIDFPDEICSILGSPYIKKLAANENEIGKSRYEIFKSGKYGDMAHAKMDKVYEEDIMPLVEEIITDKDSILSKKMKLNSNGDFATEEGKAIFRILSGDIMKFIAVKAIADTNPTQESLDKGDKGESLEYNRKELCENSFKNRLSKWEGPLSLEKEAEKFIESISKGVSEHITEYDKGQLKKYLEKRVKGLDGDTLRVSKLILNKTESGQEWRIDAARDVARIGDIMSEPKPRQANTFAENWDKVIKFWSRFINGVQKQNPKYYAIGESANLHKPYPGDHEDYKGNYPNQGSVERKFVELTKFTCPTDYTYKFSALPNLIHNAMDPEYVEQVPDLFEFMVKDMVAGWEKGKVYESPGLFRSAPVDSVLYAHSGLTNHDTFRTLHGLSLDIGEYNYYPGKSDGLQVNPDRTKRWEGTDLGKKLQAFDRADNVKKDKIKPVKEVLDKAFSVPDKWSPDWDWVIGNWDADWLMDSKNDGSKKLQKICTLGEYKKLKDKVKKDLNSQEVNAADKIVEETKEFYSKPVIMADTLLNLYVESADKLGIYSSDKAKREKLDNTVKHAISDLVTGKFMGKQYDTLHEHFGRRSVNHNWRDIVAQARYIDKSALQELPQKKIDELGENVYQKFVEPGMNKELTLEMFKAVLPGSPTLYNGQDTAETGFESNGKNVYLYNRNRIHYEWLNKPYIREFNKKLKDIIKLRTRPELSPLVNGQPIILKKIQDNKNLFGLYRYNKDTDVIAIFNTAGFNNTRAGSNVKPQSIPFIDTTREGEFGIPGGLDKGAVFVNAFNKNDKYFVDGKGNLSKQGGKITIDQPALILYREKN